MNLLNLLKNKGLTLSVSESLTGGNLQAKITAVKGISEVFKGGITAYSIEQKVKLLGIDVKHAHQVNCVSAQVAEEMALGSAKLFGTNVGIGTTGYAEPCAQSRESLAYFAICINSKIVASGLITQQLPRVEMQNAVATTVLQSLELALQ